MGSIRNTPKPTAPGAASRILWRPKVWGGLVLGLAVGLGGHLAWRHYLPTVARHPQFQITAERVHITPPPPWIRADVKAEVLRDASLVGTLSVLDDRARMQRGGRGGVA